VISFAGYVFVLSCVALLLLFIVSQVAKKRLSAEYALFWLVFGVFLAFSAFWRGILNWLGQSLGVHDPPHILTVLLGGFTLAYLVHLSVMVSISRENERRLAQELAIVKMALINLPSNEPKQLHPAARPDDR